MTLLDVRELSVGFSSLYSSIKVISDLSIHVDHGEVFGLVGESGCGKSLTAYSIMGLLPENAYAEGAVFFKDKNLLEIDREELRKLRGKDISMVFQEPMTSLNPVLKVGYQIAEVFMAHYGTSKKEALSRAVELMKAVRIPSSELRVNEYPHQMSGGMRQRIMIAMAIACRPSLLIADEPTTALDVTIQAEILQLIRNLKDEDNMSVLFITHDLGIVSEITDRVGVMYAGRIVESATVSNILNSPRHPYTMGLLDSLPTVKGKPLKPIPGNVPRPEDLPEGCRFSDRCRFAMSDCHDVEPELAEAAPGHLARCIRAGESLWHS
ncbi:oligopeptide transport ATP-binding protein OppD [bacterium BMS3Abin07]|nr:oligopeptide transport ATP-binding protein OppD [bacterium BMS3Abin07]GBE32781.1 oligopeptide transport ATP-binding protein OppD [bacterium BMS3Bbin05]HDO21566.1 ABC transporter ATP-binding protein [Nitrospirota bacterium]HDZ87238.1 ABC transporter ATP-binding protein [Nitrospirota bacterium]